ncbi:MAG: D-amino acid aminotransferase [Rhodocyclaceae bacterium]|jgi:D-alanine transaminase|nr:D-amino acid aminotransferase [Rhodocyclaceae bacterium]
MDGLAYLNGEYLPLGQARVSPMDRGFLFGDGAYEVIPVYARRPFRLDQHLARLARTLDAIRLANPHTPGEWEAIIGRVIAGNSWADQGVYLQVTRGADSRRSQAFPPPAVAPTVFLFAEPLPAPSPRQVADGVAAVSSADFRWLRCDLKTTSLLANCLLRQQAVDHGAVETVLFRDGFLTEGAASSIFMVKDGVLAVPPKSHLMLPGVTYDVVLELAAAHGVPCQVREILEAEVRCADELWMTSSPVEVLSIVSLDGRPVGDGRPGPLGRRMMGWYQDFKREVMRGE